MNHPGKAVEMWLIHYESIYNILSVLVLNFEALERIDFMLDYLEKADLFVAITFKSEAFLPLILDYCYIRREISL